MLNRIIFELNKKTHNNYSSLFMRTFLSKTQRFIFTKQSGFEFTAKFPSKIYTQKLNLNNKDSFQRIFKHTFCHKTNKLDQKKVTKNEEKPKSYYKQIKETFKKYGKKGLILYSLLYCSGILVFYLLFKKNYIDGKFNLNLLFEFCSTFLI